MPISNIHDAKTNLSKLVAAAERGEEVIIARGGKPAVRLVPCAAADQKPPRRKLFGAWKDIVSSPTEAEWARMDREIEKSFADSELFPKLFPK